MKFKEFISLLEKKHHTIPKTEKEKDLAALAEPKDKITHKDVLVGREVLAKEGMESTDELHEVLSKSAPIEDWIHDFVHSDNPKFKGKTKEERRKMAIAAYYAAHGKSKESQNESLELQVEQILNEIDVETAGKFKKAQQDLEPHMGPEGEYRDIAKNLHTKYGELIKKIETHTEKMKAIKASKEENNQS